MITSTIRPDDELPERVADEAQGVIASELEDV